MNVRASFRLRRPGFSIALGLMLLGCERGLTRPTAPVVRPLAPALPESTEAIAPRREKIALPGFFAEGLAWDPSREELLLAGIVDQSIAAVRSDGVARRFAAPDPAWSVFGIAIDASRQQVWAACSAVTQGRTLPAELGRAGLFAFTLDGQPVRKLVTPVEAGVTHLFGDLTIAADGAVFVTDTAAGAVFAAAPAATELRVVVPAKSFPSIQGLGLFDATTLVVADYSAGLVRVGLDTSGVAFDVAVVQRPKDVDLRGIDGIALRGHELAAVQNGASPPRLLRVELSADARQVKDARVWHVPDPADGEPTLATFVGDELWVTQTDRWDRVFDAAGRPRADVEIAAPVIVKIPW